MLIDQLRKANTTVSDSVAAKRAADALANYERFRSELKSLVPVSKALASTAGLLRNRSQRLAVAPPAVRGKVKTLIEEYQQGRPALDLVLPNRITNELQSKREELRQLWRDYVTQETATLRSTLEALEGILAKPQAIHEVVSHLTRVREGLPASEEQLGALDTAMAKGTSVTEDLQAGPEVLSFVRRVAEGSARLSDVTQQVQEWLKQQGLLSKLAVSFPRPRG